MTIYRSSWRDALPCVRISETSDLPTTTLAALLATAGERVAALEAYREILDATPDDLESLDALAALLARLGREEEEIAIRRRIAVISVSRMNLAPEHRSAAVAFELATLGIGAAPAEMPAGYTAALFDGYAARFDESLRGDLHYRAPERLYEALARALGLMGTVGLVGPPVEGEPARGALDICDVGCGTGLLGPLLRPLARRLDGVDWSPRMLDEARALALYDGLTEGDLTVALNRRPGEYDVVTAADVFVYIGDLGPALAAAATALRAGGLLAFTVEQMEPVPQGDGGEPGASADPAAEAGYRLTLSGRYEHAPELVRERASAAGLAEVSVDVVTLRTEQSRPVEGLVWVFRKAA